ncbi:MAG TPA: hypothetical protein VFW75_16550 [Acetobacteraceae bacterium]|nr:hypothetical protein [Acetobacteraceae bacterium]
MTGTAERYIVFRCRPIGLGHIIITLLQVLYLSDELDRIPAFDLRESHYFRDEPHREFFDRFEIVCATHKRVVTDLRTIDALYADPDLEDRGRFAPWSFVCDSSARVVVIDGTHVSSFLPIEAKPLPPPYRIGLRPGFAVRVAEALPPKPAGEKWIGLHFRHGNGEFLAWRFDRQVTPDYDVRYQEIKRAYIDLALLAAKARFGGRARVYIASDSSEFIAWCRSRLPDTLVRSDQSVDGHWEALARSGDGPAAPLAATQDLWNLSRCDFLIRGESLLPQAAFYNSETLGSSDAYEVRLPSLRTLIMDAPVDQAIAVARSVVRRFAIELRHIAPPTAQKLAGWLSERGLQADAAWCARQADWIEAMETVTAVADARSCLQAGLAAAALCILDAAGEQLAENPHYLVLRATVLDAGGDPQSALMTLKQAERSDPATPGLHEVRRGILLRLGRGRAALGAAQALLRTYGWDEANKAQVVALIDQLVKSSDRPA